MVTDEAHRALCGSAGGVEPQFAQECQDVHRRVPPAIPGRAAPTPIGGLEGEQVRPPTLGCNKCTLCCNLIGRRVGQVA
jgi:hypothetical protein